MNFNNKPRQYVENINYSQNELLNKSNLELSQINSGWRIQKMYENRCISSLNNVNIDKVYSGFITSYTIEKIMSEGNIIFYIKISVTLMFNDVGAGELYYKTNLNFTPNSDFCKLLFDLGFNVGTLKVFDPDALIDMPVWVKLKYNNDYLEVDKIHPRYFKNNPNT